jgi:DNA-binding response OmpR family regulator
MTGYAGVTFDQEYIDKFGLRLIQKPFPPNELFAAVRDILDRKRGLPAKLPLRTRSRRRSERSRPQD